MTEIQVLTFGFYVMAFLHPYHIQIVALLHTVPHFKGARFNGANYANINEIITFNIRLQILCFIDCLKSMIIHRRQQMLGIFPGHALLGLYRCHCFSL